MDAAGKRNVGAVAKPKLGHSEIGYQTVHKLLCDRHTPRKYLGEVGRVYADKTAELLLIAARQPDKVAYTVENAGSRFRKA